MKYGSLSCNALDKAVMACKTNILNGHTNQENLSVTVNDIVNVLSSIPLLRLEELKDIVFSFKDKVKTVSNADDYMYTINNILTDLIAPNTPVITIVNGPNFYSEVFNKLGISKANDVIRGILSFDYGSEFVIVSIYPTRNKIRSYGWWDPLAAAMAICCFALSDMDLLPNRLKVLIETGSRIEEEVVPEDYLKTQSIRSYVLRGDSSEY